MADIHRRAAQPVLVITLHRQVHQGEILHITIAVVLVHQLAEEFQVTQLRTTIMLGNKAPAVPGVLGVMPVVTLAHALLGTTPIPIAHGITATLAREVHGAIPHLATPLLVVPAVAEDSLVVVDSVAAVVATAVAVVADTEDDKIIRSSLYSI